MWDAWGPWFFCSVGTTRVSGGAKIAEVIAAKERLAEKERFAEEAKKAEEEKKAAGTKEQSKA